MRGRWLFALGGVLLAQGILSSSALAQTVVGDPAAGRGKAGMCRTCHGLEGRARIPIAPHIGGESAAYLSHQLTAFRDGVRTHEMMSVVAKGLDDQEISDLSAWYAAQTVTARPPPGPAGEAPPEACLSCHGADGLAVIEDAPHLAGENAIYIATQLKAFRGGKRQHPVMSEVAAGLTDAEIRTVADWYAGTEIEIEPVR